MKEARGAGSALTFVAGGERLAVAAAAVSEVLRNPMLARPPLSPDALAGVVSLRGRIVPVVAVSTLLAGASGRTSGTPRVIVVEDEGPVGLLVDEVAALVPCERLGTPGETARMIDVRALLAPHFGSRTGTGRKVAALDRAKPAASEAPVTLNEYLSFDVAGQEFGLPLVSVREVIALPPEVASVPRTDQAMRGVAALRGRLLPVLNLDVLLGLDGAEQGSDRRVIVARLGAMQVGLLVDRTREIMRVAPTQVDPVPPVLTRGDQETQVQAVCRLDGGRRLVSILSTDHLLRDGLAERIAEQATQGGEEMEDSANGETEQFLLFELGESRFGLPVACVEEVIRVPEQLSSLPKAPPFVRGVIELRGRVIPLIDQRRRFDIPGTDGGRRRIIVVRLGASSAGFIVDSVTGLVRIATADIQDSPGLAVRDSRTIDRVGMHADHGMLFLIDPLELLDKAERDLVEAMQRDARALS